MASIEIAGQVGPQTVADGSSSTLRLGRTSEQVVQQLHGRYYEQTKRGNLYTFGVSNTALVAANAIATGVTATAQPVLALWNPASSLVDLVVLKVILINSTIAGTAVSPGGFMYLASVGQNGITTGSTPFNMKTLAQAGSSAKVFSISTALTGLIGSLSTLRAVGIQTINAAGPATAITQPVAPCIEDVDGAFVIPPGGVLAIMNQLSTTTVSYSTAITWEEVSV